MNDAKNDILHSPTGLGVKEAPHHFALVVIINTSCRGKCNNLESVAGLLYVRISVYCIITVTLLTYCH